jgi:hypothetical protein
MTETASYPAIRFLLRFGNALALVVGLVIVLAGLWTGAGGAGWLCGAAIVAAGLLAFLLLRTFAELLHIVADTLLPPE